MLDDILGWNATPSRNKVLLIKDSVTAPASFLLLHFLRRILAAPESLVIFVGLKEPLSHYSKISRKQGCNLLEHQDQGSFVYIDLLSKSLTQLLNSSTYDVAVSKENKLFILFQSIARILNQFSGKNVWVTIDDLSLLEVVAQGNHSHVRNFLHYCRTLGSNNQICSLLLFTHWDIYEDKDEASIANRLDYMADTIINVEPLATGHASDVHGQVTVEHKVPVDLDSSSHMKQDYKACSLHFKILENTVLFFMPGKLI